MKTDELTRRIRELRPPKGWSKSLDGQRSLHRAVQAPKYAQGETVAFAPKVRSRAPLAIAAAVLVAVGTVVVSAQLLQSPTSNLTGPRPSNGQTVTLEGSYAFDVTDLNVVMENTSHVFVGRVTDFKSIDESTGITQYIVDPLETVKGSELVSEITVGQLGYIDEDGTSHVSEGQPLLSIGRTYLLATNSDGEGSTFTISAGPFGARELSNADQRDQLVSQYAEAAK